MRSQSVLHTLPLLAVLISPLVLGCAKTADRSTTVGTEVRAFIDEDRRDWNGGGPRPLHTQIWYPAAHDLKAESEVLGPPLMPMLILGSAAPSAELRATDSGLPLVVLSHGTGSSARMLSWIAEALAKEGYLVAAPNHHGNTSFEEEQNLEGTVLWWERSRDLSTVIDRLLADAVYGPIIDTDRIGTLGYSLGGYTALSIAGAITDRARFGEFCTSEEAGKTCDLPDIAPEQPSQAELEVRFREDPHFVESAARAGDSYRDERVRAAFSISPAVVQSFTQESLEGIEIPVEIAVGTADAITPDATNASRAAEHIPGAVIKRYPGANHFAFLPVCGWAGRLVLGEICADPEGGTRAEIHADLADRAIRFFDRTLR